MTLSPTSDRTWPGEQQPELRLRAQHLRDERADPPHRARAYGTLSSPSPSQATCPSRARDAGSPDGTCRCSSPPTRSWSWGCGGARAGISEIHDLAGLLTSLGRVTGLLGAYLALVELLLLARIPVLDAVGLERMSRWHRRQRHARASRCSLAHTVLITAGYALDDGVTLSRETDDLLTRYSGVLLATIGLGLLVVVVVSSVVAVRRRLSYRVWHALHVSRLPRDRAGLQPSARHRPRVPGPARRPRLLVGAVRRAAGGARRPAAGAPGRALAAPPAADRARRARGAGHRLDRDRRRGARAPAGARRASRCTGASSRAGTGGRRIRSRCRPRPTGGGCASRSRTSATTRAGSRRCRPGRGSSSRGRRAG